MMLSYLFLFLSSLFSAAASVLLKTSTNLSNEDVLFFLSKGLSYKVIAVGMYGLGFICYGLGLKKIELHVGYPVMVSLTIIMVVMWDLYTGLKINKMSLFAIATIISGVVLLISNKNI